jgi:hypothetical protein
MTDPCPLCDAYRQNLDLEKRVSAAQLDLFATLLDTVLIQEQTIEILKATITRALNLGHRAPSPPTLALVPPTRQ